MWEHDFRGCLRTQRIDRTIIVILEIIKEKGVAGLYRGYQATLMCNIPSAMFRFVVYKELKHLWAPKQDKDGGFPIGLFTAGAMAGALVSGIMTPVDVLKTRMATGTPWNQELYVPHNP
jgi:solute carrier family 25 S-adenosylmethionine transporter 26